MLELVIFSGVVLLIAAMVAIANMCICRDSRAVCESGRKLVESTMVCTDSMRKLLVEYDDELENMSERISAIAEMQKMQLQHSAVTRYLLLRHLIHLRATSVGPSALIEDAPALRSLIAVGAYAFTGFSESTKGRFDKQAAVLNSFMARMALTAINDDARYLTMDTAACDELSKFIDMLENTGKEYEDRVKEAFPEASPVTVPETTL
jgi:hypothetical protein